ncbi:MAG: hypothetical protein ACRD29_16530 [Acidimicrobiales bacterium]
MALLGAIAAGFGVLRWRANDRAIRAGAALPPTRALPVLALGLSVLSVVVVVIVTVGGP